MKYWVFDLDGTLVDSLSTHFQVMQSVFKKYGVHFDSGTQHEILKLSANDLPDYFHEKFGEAHYHEALRLFRDLSKESLKMIKPFSGIENVLKILQLNGKSLALWTARELEATDGILEATGLKSYFSIRVTGSCVGQGKPHPEGLQRIANHFNCTANEMVMVGDFDSDMLGAKAFGTKAIRVVWHPSVEIKKCEIAHWQFSEVEQLQNFVG